jgi:hypothetical protein
MDVTWLFHNSLVDLTRIQSVERRNGQLASAGIIIMFIDCVEKGQTISIEYYMALLGRLKDEV